MHLCTCPLILHTSIHPHPSIIYLWCMHPPICPCIFYFPSNTSMHPCMCSFEPPPFFPFMHIHIYLYTFLSIHSCIHLYNHVCIHISIYPNSLLCSIYPYTQFLHTCIYLIHWPNCPSLSLLFSFSISKPSLHPSIIYPSFYFLSFPPPTHLSITTFFIYSLPFIYPFTHPPACIFTTFHLFFLSFYLHASTYLSYVSWVLGIRHREITRTYSCTSPF